MSRGRQTRAVWQRYFPRPWGPRSPGEMQVYAQAHGLRSPYDIPGEGSVRATSWGLVILTLDLFEEPPCWHASASIASGVYDRKPFAAWSDADQAHALAACGLALEGVGAGGTPFEAEIGATVLHLRTPATPEEMVL